MIKTFTQSIIFFTILFLLFFPQKAYAYLDPGTGSLIFQMIIAFLLGASFVIKVYWRKIKAFFTNRFYKKPRDGEDDE
jgi:hypothetical protein